MNMDDNIANSLRNELESLLAQYELFDELEAKSVDVVCIEDQINTLKQKIEYAYENGNIAYTEYNYLLKMIPMW